MSNVSGDQTKIFEDVYSAYFRDIALYVARRVPRDEVEDVVAKVFLVAWRRVAKLPAPPEDRLWLFGVARRCVANHVRSAARQGRLHSKLVGEQSSSRVTSSSVDPRFDLVLVAIGKLKALDREALQLVLWDGLSHAESATVLGCSENAFELRYRRARNSVRNLVENSSTYSIKPASSVPSQIPLTRKGVEP
jgi:RNA polymerase sigma-70 factor (ECF subfamily)